MIWWTFQSCGTSPSLNLEMGLRSGRLESEKCIWSSIIGQCCTPRNSQAQVQGLPITSQTTTLQNPVSSIPISRKREYLLLSPWSTKKNYFLSPTMKRNSTRSKPITVLNQKSWAVNLPTIHINLKQQRRLTQGITQVQHKPSMTLPKISTL